MVRNVEDISLYTLDSRVAVVEQILYHLSLAGRFRDAQSFILDFHWLLDRLKFGGIERVLYDAEKYVIEKKREHTKDVFDSLRPRKCFHSA